MRKYYNKAQNTVHFSHLQQDRNRDKILRNTEIEVGKKSNTYFRKSKNEIKNTTTQQNTKMKDDVKIRQKRQLF